MLADRSFHNLYSGEKAIVPRQFIITLITNATSGNKLCNVIITMQFNGLEFVYKDGSKYILDGQTPSGSADQIF